MNFIKDNEHETQLVELLRLKANRIILCSGWLLNDGIKLIDEALKTALLTNNTPIIMYSSIKHTQEKEINKLLNYPNFTHKKLAQKTGKIHTKLYYFEYENSFTAIVGSANITKGGLKMNKELSVKIEDSIDSQNHKELINYIESLAELSQKSK